MEEQKTYTYETDTRTPVNKTKVFLAVITVCVLVAAVIAGAHFGKSKAVKEALSASEEASRLAAEATTAATHGYETGDYAIRTGGYTLLLREEPSKDSPDQVEIPDKTVLTISEVTEDPAAADENYRYWGKTEYDGKSGWIPMHYLEPQN